MSYATTIDCLGFSEQHEIDTRLVQTDLATSDADNETKLCLAKNIFLPGIMVRDCNTGNFGYDRQTEKHDAIATVDVWSKIGQHDWLQLLPRL